LRIDRDVLEHFQETGPGWQDRIYEAASPGALRGYVLGYIPIGRSA
jgi:uncharacterized protein (DUF4415 family)